MPFTEAQQISLASLTKTRKLMPRPRPRVWIRGHSYTGLDERLALPTPRRLLCEGEKEKEESQKKAAAILKIGLLGLLFLSLLLPSWLIGSRLPTRGIKIG